VDHSQTMALLDPLKVFVEFDSQYEIFVAQCLQTGHLVTADSVELAKEMIVELLEHEITLAFQADDLSELLSNPAPVELFVKWVLASKQKLDERKIVTHGEVSKELRLLLGQAEVETEVRIATGRTTARAA
jgi:hypothetical protein